MTNTLAAFACALLAASLLHEPAAAESMTNAPAPEAIVPTNAPVRVDAAPEVATNALAPVITCAAPVHDFGEADGIQPLVHTFEIKNTGTAPLQLLSVRAGCGCATTTMTTNLVAPGQAMQLGVSIALKGGKGRQRRTLYIESNDPRTPRFRLEVLATVMPYIDAQPEGVFFGALGTNDVVTNEVVVTGRSNVVFHITRVATGSPLFASEVLTNEDGRIYRVKITALAPHPVGSSRAAVEIFTDHPTTKCLTVPVTLFVASDVMVIPSALVIFGSPTGRTQYIHVYSPAQKPFHIVHIQPPDPAMDIKAEPEGEGRYRLVVKYDGAPDGLVGKTIRVATDLEGAKEVEIPIRVIPRRTPALPLRK